MELFGFGFHVVHDQGLAEEMVQETFNTFCQRALSCDASQGPVRSWLFTMAHATPYDSARCPSSSAGEAADTLRAELADLRGGDDAD